MRIGVTVALFCLTLGCVIAATTAPRPNVIFLLADDLGYGDLSVQGSRDIRTPQLDRLAAEGVRLENFYANSPICSASRASFATGQYPQRWRITSYLAYRKDNRERGMADFLDLRAPSLARILQDAGYATGHFGKWHLGGQRDVGEAPLITEYGFDRSLTQFEGLGDRLLPVFSKPMRPRWGEERRHPLGVESAGLGRGRTEFVPRAEATRRWVDATIAFIKEAQAARKPFYVNVWPDDPHTPVEPSPAARGDGSPAALYRGVVEEMDRDLGRLIDFVRHDPALRENTVIVFASDNGPEAGCGSTGGLRGAKNNLYEGGVRVPFIVWGRPAVPKAASGRVDRGTVMLGMDFAPSVLAWAGVAPNRATVFDGIDQTAALRGEGREAQSRSVFWLRPPDHPGPKGENPDATLRRGRWKLLWHDQTGEPELYDLVDDPGESRNLAATQRKLVDELAAELKSWRQRMPH